MSLIHQVLKDLDGQREVTPGEIIGYADHEYNHRVMIWPALVISILAAVFVLYFSQYFESDPSVINRSSIPVIPVTGTNPAVVPVIAEVSGPAEMPSATQAERRIKCSNPKQLRWPLHQNLKWQVIQYFLKR